MGIFIKYFSQTRKPEGFLGKIMLFSMNPGHSKLADWGLSYLPEITPEKAADLVGNVFLPLDGTASVFPKGYRRKSQAASAAFPGCTGDRLDTDAALCIRLCRRDRLRGMGRCAKGLHLWQVSGPLPCHAFRNEGL